VFREHLERTMEVLATASKETIVVVLRARDHWYRVHGPDFSALDDLDGSPIEQVLFCVPRPENPNIVDPYDSLMWLRIDTDRRVVDYSTNFREEARHREAVRLAMGYLDKSCRPSQLKLNNGGVRISSQYRPAPSPPGPTFLRRNQDRILVGVIVGVIVGVAVWLLGYFVHH